MQRKAENGGVLFLLAMLIVASGAWGSDQVPAPPQSHPIALVGGTLVPVSGEVIPQGVIVFDGGKITAMGKSVDLPDRTEIIDVYGKYVYPGLIESDSFIGLVEIEMIQVTHDYAETGDVNPNVRAEVAFNPDSEHIPITRANGITYAHVVPRGGMIAGLSALMALDGWTWETMTDRAPVGLHVYWPRMRIDRASPRADDFLKERDAQLRSKTHAPTCEPRSPRPSRAFLTMTPTCAGKP